MRKTLATLAIVAALATAFAAPASAITWGRPDTSNAYPYVGTLLFQQTDGFYR